jgi:hypothetical protein
MGLVVFDLGGGGFLRPFVIWPVIAQFVDRKKGYKVESQTGVTRTYPTQCHLDGMVLSF